MFGMGVTAKHARHSHTKHASSAHLGDMCDGAVCSSSLRLAPQHAVHQRGLAHERIADFAGCQEVSILLDHALACCTALANILQNLAPPASSHHLQAFGYEHQPQAS